MEDWNDRLRSAALSGDIEDLRLSIQKGAYIDHQDSCGRTALIFAVWGGRLDVTQLLLDKGCNRDIADNYGCSALMKAVQRRHLDVTRLLLVSGCNTDITDRDGYTALHHAAGKRQLLIVRCLVEQGGINPMKKTLKGKTPYDIAKDAEDGPYKEVMGYLQTVMSGMKDEMVPADIRLMAGKRSIDLYLKLLESGSEKKRDIRLVVVGKQGAGKTSFIRRLFGVEDITDVTSTNGIEIHTTKCKAMSDDCIWNKLDGTNVDTETSARLYKQYEETIEASVEEGAHQPVQENTPSTSFDESETVTQLPQIMSPSVTTGSQLEPPVTTESQVIPPVNSQQRDQAKMDYEAMLKYNVDLHDKEEYATLLIWDFAGDEEFYHTHQTFLSQDAIYLVVTKLNEADDQKSKEMFQLWMNSIHCYCSTTEVLGSIEEKNKSLHPPVILVGTHKDKVEASEKVKIENACRDCIDKYVEDVSADARRHISDKYEYSISNTEDNPSVFQQIRLNLLNLATTMKTWNQDYPIKFIQLEKCLQEKKKELPIISFNEIMQISTKIPKPLNHEEVMLYLKFHHELRALVYFEDLPDYIILDTQWLSDAFKCIITAEKFQSDSSRHLFTDELNDFKFRGILHSVVLDQILETNKTIFKFEEKQNLFQHKNHILEVMKKFDIIISPTVSDKDTAVTKPCYYIPCMVKKGPDCPIHTQFNVTENNCKRSTWLCFKFKFLPGHLMNHLIASLSRKYEIAEVPVRGQNKFALFKGTVVFKLQPTSKLLVMTYQSVIQIQVWDFKRHGNIERCFFSDIDHFVTEEINTIISKRFKMTTVKFDRKCDCSLAEPGCVTGSSDQDADYFCDVCTETHTNEWSPIKNTGIYEKKPKQRGLVLIVNFMFSGEEKRTGSEKDVERLTHFFRNKLKYDVVNLQLDMTKKELQDYFKQIENKYLTEKSTEYHSFTCIIMSHGNKKGIKTKDECISENEITTPFKNKPGGKFNGKPKFFLLQACRGKENQPKVEAADTCNQTSEHDVYPGYSQSRSGPTGSLEDDFCTDGSTDNPKIPKDADIIVAYATTQGYTALRSVQKGSPFITAFVDVAEKEYQHLDVEDIMRLVRDQLATNSKFEKNTGTCEMGIVQSTSTKKFFF